MDEDSTVRSYEHQREALRLAVDWAKLHGENVPTPAKIVDASALFSEWLGTP